MMVIHYQVQKGEHIFYLNTTSFVTSNSMIEVTPDTKRWSTRKQINVFGLLKVCSEVKFDSQFPWLPFNSNERIQIRRERKKGDRENINVAPSPHQSVHARNPRGMTYPIKGTRRWVKICHYTKVLLGNIGKMLFPFTPSETFFERTII